MHQSRHCPERTPPPAAFVFLLGVLSPLPDPPFPRKGLPRASSGAAAEPRRDHRLPPGGWASSSLRAPRRLSRSGALMSVRYRPLRNAAPRVGLSRQDQARGLLTTRTRPPAVNFGQFGERGLHRG